MAKDLKTQLETAIAAFEDLDMAFNEAYNALQGVYGILFNDQPATLKAQAAQTPVAAPRPSNGKAKYVQLPAARRAARQPQAIKVYWYLKRNKGTWFTVKQISRNMKANAGSLHTLLPQLAVVGVVEKANGRPQKWRVAKVSELMEKNAAARDDVR